MTSAKYPRDTLIECFSHHIGLVMKCCVVVEMTIQHKFNKQAAFHMPIFSMFCLEGALEVVNKGNLTLDEAQLKVALKQPQCKIHVDTRKLIVRGLNKKTTKTTLGCYIEKEGGAEVLSVDLRNEGCALVSFREAYGEFISFDK